MDARRLPADEQLRPDLAVRPAFDHQAQHLELASREAERQLIGGFGRRDVGCILQSQAGTVGEIEHIVPERLGSKSLGCPQCDAEQLCRDSSLLGRASTADRQSGIGLAIAGLRREVWGSELVPRGRQARPRLRSAIAACCTKLGAGLLEPHIQHDRDALKIAVGQSTNVIDPAFDGVGDGTVVDRGRRRHEMLGGDCRQARRPRCFAGREHLEPRVDESPPAPLSGRIVPVDHRPFWVAERCRTRKGCPSRTRAARRERY